MQSQEPDYKNLALAFALSLAVLFAWEFFYVKPQQEARNRAQEQSQQVSPSATPGTGIKAPGATPEGAVPGASPAAAAPQTREEAVASSPRIPVETPSLKGSIALKGGRIDDLVLVKYHETVDPKSPNVTLFSPTGSPHPYFAEYGWVAQGGSSQKVPDRDTLWTVSGPATLTPATPVSMQWDNGQGLVFKRTVSVDDNYMFTIVDTVENKGAAEVSLIPYARIRREGTPKVQGNWIMHEGLIGVIGEQGEQKSKYSTAVDDGTRTFEPAVGGWIGFTDKYWASTLIPEQKANYRAQFQGWPERSPAEPAAYQTDYVRDAVTIAPGQTASVEAQLFAGAKEVKVLQQYQSTGVEKFDLLIDWGWFFFITKPLFYLMEAINSVVHNFGVTILILTVLVRLAFFPLANKQYASMAKMKKLQPQIEAIRERYKDDKAKLQQAQMDLYRDAKVNPIAGCLPVLLQFPVFFALYKVLYITIDMRHAPFFGWIKDLSAPDPTSLFNLFGLLPYQVPEFLHIGVWPLLMGITMWLQMQLNPQQADPVQQQIFNWMPVIFTFMLAAFPAGLVIYWAWSNTLSLAQQSYIMKKQGAEIHLAANLKSKFGALATARERLGTAVKQWLPGKSAADTSDEPHSGGKPHGEDKHRT
ncbi:MAG TPA: membrane protein insertase YidC [Hyphomicrobium sp.]|nr:membrane protein insertase YidC [Hyphomicrobium sp.]